MTARGYEHEKIKFISKSRRVIFCLLYKHRINSCEKGTIYSVCNHSDGDLFTCEDNTFYCIYSENFRQ